MSSEQKEDCKGSLFGFMNYYVYPEMSVDKTDKDITVVMASKINDLQKNIDLLGKDEKLMMSPNSPLKYKPSRNFIFDMKNRRKSISKTKVKKSIFLTNEEFKLNKIMNNESTRNLNVKKSGKNFLPKIHLRTQVYNEDCKEAMDKNLELSEIRENKDISDNKEEEKQKETPETKNLHENLNIARLQNKPSHEILNDSKSIIIESKDESDTHREQNLRPEEIIDSKNSRNSGITNLSRLNSPLRINLTENKIESQVSPQKKILNLKLLEAIRLHKYDRDPQYRYLSQEFMDQVNQINAESEYFIKGCLQNLHTPSIRDLIEMRKKKENKKYDVLHKDNEKYVLPNIMGTALKNLLGSSDEKDRDKLQMLYCLHSRKDELDADKSVEKIKENYHSSIKRNERIRSEKKKMGLVYDMLRRSNNSANYIKNLQPLKLNY